MDILKPSRGAGPGVLVVHPWWGLNQSVRDYGAALVREGFVVGLPDVFEGHVVTEIDADFEGDTFAPVLDDRWHETARERHVAANGLHYSFVTYNKS